MLKIIFAVLNIILGVMMASSIIVRLVYKGYDGKRFYDIAMQISSLSSAIVAIAFVMFVSIIIVKLRAHLKFCSKPVIQFIFVGLMFLILNFCRTLGLSWSFLTKSKMNLNFYMFITYFFPEMCSIITIHIM